MVITPTMASKKMNKMDKKAMPGMPGMKMK
jgi:hypothetical protein